jgi:Mlc titration factor MtfA (ptsG expression regulator)
LVLHWEPSLDDDFADEIRVDLAAELLQRGIGICPAPLYSLLSPAEQQKLIDAARIIAAERRFEGCKGLIVTDEVRITIAAQAAIMLLGEEGYFFERVEAFLIYPFAVVVPPHGIRPADEEDDDRIASGVAHHEGQIVLSWPDVVRGGRDASDAQNVVLHELAHHLDGLDGEMGGSPPAATAAERSRWRNVLARELDVLRQDLAEGRRTLLHPPAAENTTEVFAYGTECFFEKPLALRSRHSELFACFRAFYKVDPCAWFEGTGERGDQSAVAETRVRDCPNAKRDHAEKRPLRKLPTLRSSDEYFTRGLEYFQRGRHDQAEADFNQAVRMAPDDQEALA